MRWRRLDVPGSDECRLLPARAGWRVEGVAQFLHGDRPARLCYEVACDVAWRTTRGDVHGELGGEPLRLTVRRDASDAWVVGEQPRADLAGLIDLDLGFTPATNLFPLRRLALEVGQAADAEAAWLDDTVWSFRRLPQRYERRDASSYWYEAPTVGYAGLLTLTAEGFIREYPGLWIADG
jgi:uncharacterized protein